MNVTVPISTSTQIAAKSKAPAPDLTCERLDNFGPKPTMCMLPKSALRVDRRYQREISSRRSKQLIQRIADNWRWYHCAPLTVADNGDGTYNVIDGQHRMTAAKSLPGVVLLPAYVVEEMTLQEQAGAFVAHNMDRVAVSPQAIFYA